MIYTSPFSLSSEILENIEFISNKKDLDFKQKQKYLKELKNYLQLNHQYNFNNRI